MASVGHVRKASGLSQKPHHTPEGRGGLCSAWLLGELIQGSDETLSTLVPYF